MIEYIKMLIVALVTGLTAPLPASSAAHYNFFSNIVGLSSDTARLSLYYNCFIFVFSFVILLSFRKTVSRGLKLAFSFKTAKYEDNGRDKFYFVKNVLLSVIPTLILFIPVSEGKILSDYMDSFLNLNGLILSGIACIVTACILITAMWYTSKTTNPIRRAVDKKTVVRLSVYQLPCYVIPGFSHIASGTVNLFISDIGAKSLIGQLYIYIGPSMFLVSGVKLVRLFLSGIIVDPFVLALGIAVFALASKLMISLAVKSNIRRLFTFFCVYSVVFGVFITAISFFI